MNSGELLDKMIENLRANMPDLEVNRVYRHEIDKDGKIIVTEVNIYPTIKLFEIPE